MGRFCGIECYVFLILYCFISCRTKERDKLYRVFVCLFVGWLGFLVVCYGGEGGWVLFLFWGGREGEGGLFYSECNF